MVHQKIFVKKALAFFRFLVGDFNISDIFYHAQTTPMAVLREAASWGIQTMARTVHGVPEVSLEYRMFGQWHFSGAPKKYQNFLISTSPRLVNWDHTEMINWCPELLKVV